MHSSCGLHARFCVGYSIIDSDVVEAIVVSQVKGIDVVLIVVIFASVDKKFQFLEAFEQR